MRLFVILLLLVLPLQADLLTNLVSYWKMDESSGGTGDVSRADAHGSNTLTDINTTASGTGIINNGAHFVYDDGTILTNTSPTGMSPGSGDFSISLWLYLEYHSNYGENRLIGKWRGPSLWQQQFKFNVEGSSPTFYLRLVTNTVTYGSETRGVEQNLSHDTWHHLVVTWDASAHTAEFFVDGSSVGSDSSGSGTEIVSDNAPLDIGGTNNSTPSDFLGGIVDEVGYWSRLLTGAEITSLHNSGAGLAYPFGISSGPVRRRVVVQ